MYEICYKVRAYQEILGDMHNLFVDTDSVNVELLADDSYRLAHVEQCDTVDDVQDTSLEELEAGLSGYTYFED
jgi:arginine decarboxylase-like protein